MFVSLIGLSAGILCTLSFIPQVIKIWKDKSAKGLSLPTFLVFFLGILLWLIYGCLLGNFPIILANSMTLVLVLIILIFKFRYG